MVARLAGASLGLFAFAVACIAGLIVRNPVEIVLSRSILALFVFCVLGLLLGGVAERVVAERERQREAEIKAKYAVVPAGKDAGFVAPRTPPSSA